MRRTLLASIAALALASASSVALAADIPPPEPVMSWTGFYLGGGGGIGWADIDVNARRCGRHLHVDHHEVADVIVDDNGECDPDFDLRREFNEDSDSEFVGIVQGGFDWEVAPSFVVGVMASGSSRTLLTRETSTTMTASLMNSVDAIASSPVSTAY